MKKIFAGMVLLVSLFISTTVSAKVGDYKGDIYYTDIKTYMFGNSIESYNIGGKTIINADSLDETYGFSTTWHSGKRILEINETTGISNKTNYTYEYGGVIGQKSGEYYETDIVTILNGKEIQSYNLGGKTFIIAENLTDYGYNVQWNNEKRTLNITRKCEHNWDMGTIISKATCTSEGTISYKCNICGIDKVEVIPINNEHNWQKSILVEPTYKTEGILRYLCKRCNYTYDENIGTYNFNPENYNDSYHIITSNNPENYIELTINNNTLTIEGKIIKENLDKVWFRCGEKNGKEYGEIIEISDGKKFIINLSLSHIKEDTKLKIYTHQKNDDVYWGYIWKEIIIHPDKDGYKFLQSMVLEHNIDVMKHWVDPKDCLSENISEEIKQLSNSIVGTETDEYKKLYLLNKWVAENIYYDYDYYYGKTKELYYKPEDVYKNKRSVCEGYSRLLNSLIQSQGIPSMQVITYSAGISTIGYFDESNYMTTQSNHAHVEAYLKSENRWVIMDPTWDSNNKYENEEYIEKSATIRYFDISFDFFSFTHKIIKR